MVVCKEHLIYFTLAAQAHKLLHLNYNPHPNGDG